MAPTVKHRFLLCLLELTVYFAVKLQIFIGSHSAFHILPAIGCMKIDSVKSYHLQQFLNTQAGKSNSQLQKIRGVINQMFLRAELDRVINHTPARKLFLPKGTEKPRRSITEAERAALYKAIEFHKGKVWILFMLRCGLRRGETIPLRWKDIDFETGILTINKAIEYDRDTPKVKSTKTESGIRYVPIPPDFLQLLKERKKIRREDDNHLIIYNRNGRMFSQTQVRRMWISVQRRWDIALGAETSPHGKVLTHVLDQDITPHYLRHTYCTDLRRQGISLIMPSVFELFSRHFHRLFPHRFHIYSAQYDRIQ
nr:site-specific integrase [uncultured Agathobaculum sp.]